jgi:16S rRNA (guanine1516-N2)-methyltransferase
VQVTFPNPRSEADRQLCRRFGIAAQPADAGFRLERRDGVLHLCGPTANGDVAFAIDLQRGRLAQRLRTSKRSDALPRAIGLGRGAQTVVDALAGLGRDAMTLASLGADVLAIEAVPALAAMLTEAAAAAPFAARLVVRFGDAATLLAAMPPASVDCVYLDPMFETHGKAQVQKASQLLRALAAPPADVAALFAAATACARQRVVVKRPPGAAPLHGEPSFTVGGQRAQFHVYLVGPR